MTPLRHALPALLAMLLTRVALNAAQPETDTRGKTDMTYLFKDGQPLGKLYLPAQAGKAVWFAAGELREHLEAITGGRLETDWADFDPEDPRFRQRGGIVLRRRPEADVPDTECPQAFTIEQTASPAPRVTITGNSDLGVLYGVYQYLSDLGVRWLAPGDIGTNLPRTGDVPIRPGRHSHAPAFASRAMGLSSTAANHFGGVKDRDRAVTEYALFLIRNRTHLQSVRGIVALAYPFALSRTGTGHTLKPMTGLREWFDAGGMDIEPERFALVTGHDFIQKRRYHDGQACFTHETNIRNAISNSIAFVDRLDESRPERATDLDRYATVPMGLSDTFGLCECERCARVAGEGPYAGDRLVWWFFNRVARGLDAARPGRMIAVHSPYMDLTRPPDDVRIEPNIMVETPLVYMWERSETDPDGPYDFPRSFRTYVDKTVAAGATTLSSYNYLLFPWSPTLLFVLDAARKYADRGYTHYHLESMQRTEYAWPIVWSLAQFTWDSRKAPRDYLEMFCQAYYGEPFDRDVLWLFESMTTNARAMERIVFGGSPDTATMFPDGLIAEARRRLGLAVRRGQGRQRERLQRLNIALEAQFQLAEVYRAYCRALNTRQADDIEIFTKRALGLRAYWRQNNLDAINSTARNPERAAEAFLRTDFTELNPAARAALAGKGPADAIWMQELFAGENVPDTVPNLFPLPENWKFHLDYDNRGLAEGFYRTDFDDSEGWPLVSSWDMPSNQGYHRQVGGWFWYRVAFEAPRLPEGRTVWLRIGSLDDSGDIYLNGVKVGSQPDPRHWDRSFAIDITETIRPGAINLLAIRGYDATGGEGVWRPSALYTD